MCVAFLAMQCEWEVNVYQDLLSAATHFQYGLPTEQNFRFYETSE